MAENKRYFWLKLHEDFFGSKRIKKLRKLGADYVIIYLKLQLMSLNNGGIIEFTGIEDTLAKELELEIDEDADKIQLTLSFLQSCGLLTINEDNEFILPYVDYLTGSETASTVRSRKSRAGKVLQCNTSATLLQQDATKCNREIDKEIDIDKDKENISKQKYGESKNVLLTDDEYKKLQEKFPADYQQRIEELSNGLALYGYKYKSHYRAILKWAENNKKKQQPKENKFNNFEQRKYDYDDLERKLLNGQ